MLAKPSKVIRKPRIALNYFRHPKMASEATSPALPPRKKKNKREEEEEEEAPQAPRPPSTAAPTAATPRARGIHPRKSHAPRLRPLPDHVLLLLGLPDGALEERVGTRSTAWSWEDRRVVGASGGSGGGGGGAAAEEESECAICLDRPSLAVRSPHRIPCRAPMSTTASAWSSFEK